MTLVDPKITEAFLLDLDEVQDASVWLTGKKLHAHVTGAPGTHLDCQWLISACEDRIGRSQTPEDILVIANPLRA